jgi:hypothetical protein
MSKPRVKIGRRLVRQDCFDNDCHDVRCDVCHLHDEPADEDGYCKSCKLPGQESPRYDVLKTVSAAEVKKALGLRATDDLVIDDVHEGVVSLIRLNTFRVLRRSKGGNS